MRVMRAKELAAAAVVMVLLAGCSAVPEVALSQARDEYSRRHPGAESYKVGAWRSLQNCVVMELQGSAGEEVFALARSSEGLEQWWVADSESSNYGETFKKSDEYWQNRCDAVRRSKTTTTRPAAPPTSLP